MITQIINLDNTDSTQNVAKQLAMDGAQSGTVIFTRTQSGGKGQFDRRWSSPEGGLYFSLILRPHKQIYFSPSLSIKVAEAVAGTLRALYGFKTKIKHPNDVLVLHNKKWLKICGILIESSSYDTYAEWFAIGVGVNLNNKIPAALKDIAVSVSMVTGVKTDKEEFSAALFKNLSKRYREWLNSAVQGEIV